MTNEPKSVEEAASEAANAFYNPKLGMSIEDVFHKGVAFQREREALLVEALDIALEKTKDVAKNWHGEIAWDIYENHAPEMKPYRDARAALLKYRGSL